MPEPPLPNETAKQLPVQLTAETVRTAVVVLCLYASDHPANPVAAEAWAAADAMFLALAAAAQREAERVARLGCAGESKPCSV